MSRTSAAYEGYEGQGSHIVVPTTDTSGSLRIVNSGAFAFGYFLDGASWVELWSAKWIGFAGDPIMLSAWSDDTLFGDADVAVEFSNLRITGEVIPLNGKAGVPEPSPFMDWALLFLLPCGVHAVRVCRRAFGRRRGPADWHIRRGVTTV